MIKSGIDIQKIEKQLKGDVSKFLNKTCLTKVKQHNFRVILLQLTGYSFLDFPDKIRLQRVKKLLESALFSERKKARSKRCEYNLNRHIALYQARKILNKMDKNLSRSMDHYK